MAAIDNIETEVNRIKDNIADSYDACAEKDADMPIVQNSANLPATIRSIQQGGGTVIANDVIRNIDIMASVIGTSPLTESDYSDSNVQTMLDLLDSLTEIQE